MIRTTCSFQLIRVRIIFTIMRLMITVAWTGEILPEQLVGTMCSTQSFSPNTMVIFSNYNYSYILKDDARHFKWSSDLQELDVKTDFDYFPNPEKPHQIWCFGREPLLFARES